MTAADLADMGENPPIPLAVVQMKAPETVARLAEDATSALLQWRRDEITQPMTAMQVLERVERLRDVADRIQAALDAAGRDALARSVDVSPALLTNAIEDRARRDGGA